MKIGIFTDSHYSSQDVTYGKRFNSKSLQKIKAAYTFFKSQNCDLVICLGDLIDKEATHEKEVENLKDVAKVINEIPIKTVCLMGNHDAFAFTGTEFYDILGIAKPETIKADDKALIFIDACYFKNGNHYLPGDSGWTDTFYPHIQDLKKQLEEATGDVYIFVHQNLDPTIRKDHCVYNADEINTLLFKSGKVKMVFQGHYHTGNKCIYNNIRYLTFPALCENEDVYFIEEI